MKTAVRDVAALIRTAEQQGLYAKAGTNIWTDQDSSNETLLIQIYCFHGEMPKPGDSVILTTKTGPGMTQKLAGALLRPARFRPAGEDHCGD